VIEPPKRKRPTAGLVIDDTQSHRPVGFPGDIDAIASGLRVDPTAIWTAVCPLTDREALRRPDVVKAAVAGDGRVLYFSRAPIPHVRGDGDPTRNHHHHVGIYGYAVETLRKIVALPVSPLEKAESLEQLRALEAGITIRAVTVGPRAGGIDTREDLERARQILENGIQSGGGA